MAALQVIFFCLFGVLSGSALPQSFWRDGVVSDPDPSVSTSIQSHLPSLTGTLTSVTKGLPSLPIKPPSVADLPQLPVKPPTVSHLPTLPVDLSSIKGIPSPVAIVSVDPSKIIPGIKGPLPFNAVAIGSSFVKPIASYPLVLADQIYDIPLHTWDSLKNIIDATVNLPKEEISAGQKAVDDLFSSLSG